MLQTKWRTYSFTTTSRRQKSSKKHDIQDVLERSRRGPAWSRGGKGSVRPPRTGGPTFMTVGTQSICASESNAKVFKKLKNLVLTSHTFPRRPSREAVQGLVKNSMKMRAVDLTEVYSSALFNQRSMQLDLKKGVTAELESEFNPDFKSRRHKCNIERSAKSKILKANPQCPSFLKLQDTNIGKSNQLESTENAVITTRSHLMLVVRECLNRCVVVVTSSSHVHRTRRVWVDGVNRVFASPYPIKRSWNCSVPCSKHGGRCCLAGNFDNVDKNQDCCDGCWLFEGGWRSRAYDEDGHFHVSMDNVTKGSR